MVMANTMANPQTARARRFPRMTSTAVANSQPDHEPTDVADQPSRDTMDPLRTKTVPTNADAITPSRSTRPNTYPPVPPPPPPLCPRQPPSPTPQPCKQGVGARDNR